MKRKRIVFFVIAAVLAAAAVVSIIQYISWNSRTPKAQVDLYFMNADNTGIEAEPRTIRYNNENELIQNTMSQLMKGPSGSKRGRIIPDGAKINRIVLDSSNITVDFSQEFLTPDSPRNVLAVYAVVKTLYSTGLAQLVEVTVEGNTITDPDGSELGFISALDINLENEEYYSEMRGITLYFGGPDNTLKRETRTVKVTDQQPIEQYIINELIKGPTDGSLSQLLSKKTVLISVDVEGSICYLNFKSNFIKENNGSAEHEQLVIDSIVNSLTELESIARVQFYMDGKRVESFGSVRIKDYISRGDGGAPADANRTEEDSYE